MKTFLVLLSSALCSHAAFFKVNLRVEENGTFYNQSEEFDPMTADVITSVPAHMRGGLLLHEIQRIENEGLGLAVWKLDDDAVCHLEALDPAEDPTHFLLEVATMEARNVTVISSRMTTEYVYTVDGGEWAGNRADLTSDMQTLCDGISIRNVTKSFVTKDEFDAIIGGQGGRKRRQAAPSTRAWCLWCSCWWCGWGRSSSSNSSMVHVVSVM